MSLTASSGNQKIDQLAILIVSGRQVSELVQQLRQHQFHFTQIDSSGGVIQETSVSLFIGLNRLRLNALLKLVRQCCKPQKEYIPTQVHLPSGFSTLPMIEAQVGGALVYVLNVERFEQL